MERGENTRVGVEQHISQLADRVGALTDQMHSEQNLMHQMAETQVELKAVLTKLADRGQRDQGFDDATRTHIRNLDAQASRIASELGQGRNEVLDTLRSEMKLLARTVAASANADNRQR